METIQVVIDTKLLQATDAAARSRKLNRSALIRTALREHLRHLQIRDLEERDRRGYERIPQDSHEASILESEAAWPQE
jgi:metal-responsive CopG/Arc/MetJ family transcriptional regulator